MCCKCKIEQPITSFSKQGGKKKSKLRGRCRSCCNTVRMAYYRRNSNSENIFAARLMRRRKFENYQKLWEYFKEHPCVDCGETDPIVLQSDHVRGQKRNNISTMVCRGWAWSSILTELEKCETRCANCHMRKTAREQGWFKAMAAETGQEVPAV